MSLNEKPNQLSSDEIKELVGELEKSYGKVHSYIRNRLKTGGENENHFASVMMSIKYLYALQYHILWKINEPRFSDDVYIREKMGKLQKEFDTY